MKKEKEDCGRDFKVWVTFIADAGWWNRVGLRFRSTQNKACRLDATKDIKEKWKLMTDERDFRLQNEKLMKSEEKKYLQNVLTELLSVILRRIFIISRLG